MSHEQSETIQGPDGKWINVYGKATQQAGKQLPGTSSYGTVDEAVKAAQERSKAFGHTHSEPVAPLTPSVEDSRAVFKKNAERYFK